MKPRLQLDMVARFLRDNPKARDNDDLLCALVWYHEAISYGLQDDAPSFLRAYAKSRFTPAETITRSRRKAQELFPELRGNRYIERKESSKIFKP